MTDAGTVAVTDHPFRDLDIERAILEPRGYSVAEHQCGTADEVLHACADAVGVLNTYAPMPAEVIGRLERCRAIARYRVGLDTIDAPLTDKTRRLVDEAFLRRMPARAVLLNTARGPLVDTEALDRALDEGWIGGAARDLLETEPPVPDLALLGHEDLIVTAHQAFHSEEALRELQRKAAQNLLDGLEATS